jgi:uncharacterized RDD family membrane protein YckC
MSANSDQATPFVFASFAQRTQAFLIDCFVFIPITCMHNYSILYGKNFSLVVLASVLWFIYKPYMEFKYGATLGKKIMKLKVVNYEGDLADNNQIMLRFLPYFAIGLSNLILFYSMFQHPDFVAIQSLQELSSLQRDTSSSATGLASLFYLVSVSVILFDAKKQALHDRFSSTYCIHTN